MRYAKDAELVAIFGRRGSGKSTLAKALINDPARRKVIVFDTQREYPKQRGWFQVETRKGLLQAMKRRWKTGFKFSYVPPPGNEAEALHWVARMCWEVQIGYDAGTDGRKLTLVVEEANLSMPTTPLPRELDGMPRVINQGRHRGLEVIAISQRPALVSKTFRANCARTYVFALAEADDRREILRSVGRGFDRQLRELNSYKFLCVENGKVGIGNTTINGFNIVDRDSKMEPD